MKTVILAAGFGSRLLPHTINIPKPLLSIGNQTIIGNLLTGLKKNGITDITIVTGYLHHILKAYVESTFRDYKISYMYNSHYRDLNNLYSFVLFASNYYGEDIMVINADVFCDQSLIRKVIQSPLNMMLVDKDAIWTEEATKVHINNEIITNIGKQLELADSNGEYIGIMKLSQSAAKLVCEQAIKMIDSGEGYLWYPYAVAKVIEQIKIIPIYTDGLVWVEVDTKHDWQKAISYFNNDRL